MTEPVRVGPLRATDLDAAHRIRRHAFGFGGDAPPPGPYPTPGMTRLGAFDPNGEPVGTITDLHHEQWWGGRRVKATGIASVAVAPHARGRGIARAMLKAVLGHARERGAAVSALFPTVAAPYRASGWEFAGDLETVDLAAAALPTARPSAGLTVRDGTGRDLPAVVDLYERFARTRDGMLTRRGDLFAPRDEERLPDGIDGVLLVHRGGRLAGYVSWLRGAGYDRTSVLTVHDALAVDDESAVEIVSHLGGWRSVTPTIRLRPTGFDAVTRRLPMETAVEHRRQRWMHRPVDVAAAVAARGWPAHARGTVEFRLVDPVAEWNDGCWRLVVDGGEGRLEPVDHEPEATLRIGGFAALYAGAATASGVAEAGLVSGGDVTALNLLAAGGPARLLDYF